MQSDSEWVHPAKISNGPRVSGWHHARDRIQTRMEQLSGRKIEHFTIHDLRRTARTIMSRIEIKPEVAEAMLNHLPPPLERIYDQYERSAEKRDGFLALEAEILRIARAAGVAELLAAPRS